MNDKCKIVVFSDKAYNAIICETLCWHPAETGGFLLGQKLDNGTWYVIEAIPPGYSEGNRQDRVFHETGYFEPNTTFSEYLSNTIASQYELPLTLLGLWHRHPGSMDFFSGTDDETNSRLAISLDGIISGLVNVDPNLRMTMRYVPNDESSAYRKPNYKVVDIEIGTDLIPDDFLKLKYCNGINSNLNPSANYSNQRKENAVNIKSNYTQPKPLDIREITENTLNKQENQHEGNHQKYCLNKKDGYQTIREFLKKNKKKSLIVLILAIVSIFSIKAVIDYGKSVTEYVISWFNDNNQEPKISKTKLTLMVGGCETLHVENLKENKYVKWESSNNQVATISKKGKVKAIKEGETIISIYVGDDEVGKCQVTVESNDESLNLSKYTLSHTALQMLIGDKFTLKINGANGKTVIWKSNADDIAVVNGGKVEAVNEGSTDIIAVIDNEELICSVQVLPEPEEDADSEIKIKIKTVGNSGKGQLKIGETGKMSLMTTDGSKLPDNIDKTNIIWESEDTSIATIDNTGKIEAINEGVIDISVFYKEVKHDSFELTVIKK